MHGKLKHSTNRTRCHANVVGLSGDIMSRHSIHSRFKSVQNWWRGGLISFDCHYALNPARYTGRSLILTIPVRDSPLLATDWRLI